MSLFPAYSDDPNEPSEEIVLTGTTSDLIGYEVASSPASSREEAQLLASDDEEASAPPKPSPSIAPAAAFTEFYLDNKLDCGNLRVSTLYYPGRPEYKYAEGMIGGRVGTSRRRRRRLPRYYELRGVGGAEGSRVDGGEGGEVAQRTASYHRMLQETPHDELLWLQFIDFQERFGVGGSMGSAGSAMAAGEAARSRLPGSRVLRRRLLALQREHMSHSQYTQLLNMHILQEQSPEACSELRELLVSSSASVSAVLSAAAGAARGAASIVSAYAYPRLIYVTGSCLRSAGHWEKLVRLIELQLAINYPPATCPAPPPSAAQEELLLDYEDKVVSAGLPLQTSWSRVERARAAAHWAPLSPSHEGLLLDATRAGGAGEGDMDVTSLLQPVTRRDQLIALAINMIRMLDVPLLVSATSHCVARLGEGQGGAGEVLLPLLTVVCPSHTHAARLLALAADPPNYYTDNHGLMSWVCNVWTTLILWCKGSERDALLCWRLRWHRSLLTLQTDSERSSEEARVRAAMRALLKQAPPTSAVVYADLATLEGPVGGKGGNRAFALLRAAVSDDKEPHHHLLYIARVVCELSGRHSPEGRWALVSAVLRRAPPPSICLAGGQGGGLSPPPAELLAEAIERCHRECSLLDSVEETTSEEACSLLLPGPGEWVVTRALLAPCPPRRLVQHRGEEGGTRYRWSEEEAVATASVATARSLLTLYPHNVTLAALSSRVPLWTAALSRGGWSTPPFTATSALSHALPALLHAVQHDWQPLSAERCVRAMRRATEGGGGAGGAAWALRGEAEVRGGDAGATLCRVIEARPLDKWAAVRAGGGDAEELMLERGLRVHVLTDELKHI